MTTYLSRTPSSAGNRKKYTWSGWIKNCATGSAQQNFMAVSTANNDFNLLYFNGAGNLVVYFADNGSTGGFLQTSALFIDPNAWYHIVFRFDSTHGTADNRIRLYVNGIQQTDVAYRTNPSLNYEGLINTSGNRMDISGSGAGMTAGANSFFGIMSHVHFLDGEDRDASYFGETDSTTGEWKIKTNVTGVNYGTNGFFILKDGNSVTDQSGQGNNFTVSSGTLTKTEDNPSNVFATLNPLVKPNDYTLSQGNNTIAYGNATARACCLSTLGMSSGKFYAELKVIATSTTPCQAAVGIANNSDNTNSGYYPSQGNTDNAASYQFWDGTKNIGSSGAAYGNTVAANDIMGFAFDIDNKAMYVSKNGVWQGSGVPTSGASKTNAIDFSSITDNGFWFLIVGDGSGVQTFTSSFNFGNGYFGTTAVSSAGTNASGNGIFEYDVPTGYTALSTKGLNL